MRTNWFVPFPRDALVLTYHDSEKLYFSRPSTDIGTLIPVETYLNLERERKEWLDNRVLAENALKAARRAEIEQLELRRTVRDTREATSIEVFKRLKSIPGYVDVERWRELLKWLEEHPFRVLEQDQQMIELDARLEKLLQEDVSKPTSSTRTGRPRGTKHSEESNQKRSRAMSDRWKQWKASGSVPKVGRKATVNEETERSSPY